jgi:hypothetical protein
LPLQWHWRLPNGPSSSSLVVACCLSNSSVASPLRAATKWFWWWWMEQRRCSHLLLFVIVWRRVRHDAPGALRGPFFHSGRVAASGAFRGHLPVQLLSFSCRVHCPYLLLCLLYVWCLHAQRLSSLGTTCRVNRCCGSSCRSVQSATQSSRGV